MNTIARESAYVPLVVTHRCSRVEVTSLDVGEGASACACSGAGAKQPPDLQHFPVLDVKDVVALEQALAAAGTPLLTLMERAGAALAQYVVDAFPAPSKVALLCGSGNNGGDGWVAARLLAASGYRVTLHAVRCPVDMRAEPARTAALAAGLVLTTETSAADQDGIDITTGSDCAGTTGGVGGSIYIFTDGGDAFSLDESDVVIDCLLGTGFDGGVVKDPYRDLIKRANATRAFLLACDVPSGMNAQTGAVHDACTHADATVTMLAVKTGLVSTEVTPYVGKLFLAPLGQDAE